jgi:hypothetical protein
MLRSPKRTGTPKQFPDKNTQVSDRLSEPSESLDILLQMWHFQPSKAA